MRELENKIRDVIREGCGGHSLESMSGDKLWQTREPINITKLARVQTKREAELVKALESIIKKSFLTSLDSTHLSLQLLDMVSDAKAVLSNHKQQESDK